MTISSNWGCSHVPQFQKKIRQDSNYTKFVKLVEKSHPIPRDYTYISHPRSTKPPHTGDHTMGMGFVMVALGKRPTPPHLGRRGRFAAGAVGSASASSGVAGGGRASSKLRLRRSTAVACADRGKTKGKSRKMGDSSRNLRGISVCWMDIDGVSVGYSVELWDLWWMYGCICSLKIPS